MYVYRFICTYVHNRYYIAMTLCMIIFTVILVLRKYYSNLADSFFDDHITTMGILQTKFYVKDTFFSDIISMTDHKMANQRMLNALMILIQADNQMMNFCGAVLDLCSRDKFCDELVEFTKGRFYNYIRTVVRKYVWYIRIYAHTRTI